MKCIDRLQNTGLENICQVLHIYRHSSIYRKWTTLFWCHGSQTLKLIFSNFSNNFPNNNSFFFNYLIQ